MGVKGIRPAHDTVIVDEAKTLSLHTQLIDVAYKWVLKRTTCGIAFKDLHVITESGERPDVIGFGSFGTSVLIEVKTSRSDFLSDKKKKFRIQPHLGMGKWRFYCCPKGLIRKEELPESWGLIYVNENLKPRAVLMPYKGNVGERSLPGMDRNLIAEHGYMYSALRRLALRGRLEEIYNTLDTDQRGFYL